MESFFSLLQKNVLDRHPWSTRDQLHNEIVHWIEHTYNRRRQRALGKLTPVEYELALSVWKRSWTLPTKARRMYSAARTPRFEVLTRQEAAVTGPPNEAGGASGVARAAVGLAALVVIVVVVSYTIFFVALAAGGDDAISDNGVGVLAGVSLLGGLVVSLVAMVLAIVARVRQDRWRLLWLPRSVFPTLLVLVVLAEVFVME